jgi:predicted enzyme related to lactoylglutathione lyase
MAKVLGVGGVFFKCADPVAVREWYQRVLGFEVASFGAVLFPPLPIGKTVWSPFAADTKYFAPSQGTTMINFVVDDIDGVLEKAEKEGVHALGRDDQDGIGRFAWLMDPAGMKIELWQPQ